MVTAPFKSVLSALLTVGKGMDYVNETTIHIYSVKEYIIMYWYLLL